MVPKLLWIHHCNSIFFDVFLRFPAFFFLGVDHMLTMDLHSKEVQGFYECPVDNLRASPFLIQYIQERVGP